MGIAHGIVILISFFFGLACIKYIRTYDIHEKEPVGKMMLATVWGGMWSIVISVVLYSGVQVVGFEIRGNWTGALLGIGPIEEFGKLVAFLSCYFFIRKELNEPADGMIYMACVALGFSLIENVFYAVDGSSVRYGVLFARMLICTPVHILFSVFMGLGLYAWLRMHQGVSLLVFAFLYASIAHGVYDGIVFGGMNIVTLAAIVYLFYRMVLLALSFLEYATAISPARCSLATFVRLSRGRRFRGFECLHCGSLNPKEGYNLGDIHFQKCDACPCYVTTKRGLGRIFNHFGSRFRKRRGEYFPASLTGEKFSTLCRDNYVSDAKGLAFFYLAPLSEALEGINTANIQAMQDHWWFPELQRFDGNCLALDIAGLLAWGEPLDAHSGSVIWSEQVTAEPYASAEYVVHVNADGELELVLHYPHSVGVDGDAIMQRILIKRYEDLVGRSTYRFACPVVHGGEVTCNQLVECIYLPVDTRRAGCDKCGNVTFGIRNKARFPRWRPETSRPEPPQQLPPQPPQPPPLPGTHLY
ncbi:MAG: PrsW family intramembrane metalloprotease [Phycisphaerae bacterium]|jgi:RsiW-degrading membrane proteinase PrsW (M82 family)|nr:PrsW family intramembrane metalloprotease [Phycisphaerae bacterium]